MNNSITGLLITVASFLAIFSCKEKGHYRINCCEDGSGVDHNGILFLVESGNYLSLQRQYDTINLRRYLSGVELINAFDKTTSIEDGDTSVYDKYEFLPFDTLFVNGRFVAELVLFKDNSYGREYFFQVRTYDKSHKLISVQDFAVWSDRLKKYCSGDFFMGNQTFEVTCDDATTKYSFDRSGKIVLVTN